MFFAMNASNQSLPLFGWRRWKRVLIGISLTLLTSSVATAEAGAMNDVMRILEQSMSMIDKGIAKLDYSIVVAGAKQIEERPMPSWIDRAKIFADLGSEAPAFKEADKEMRRLARKIAESAERHDLEALRQAVSQLRHKCITCHKKQTQSTGDNK